MSPTPRNPSKPHSRHRGRSNLVALPPDGCTLPVPDMPAGRPWTDHERARWEELWQSPQATMWDESARGTVALLVAYESRLLCGDGGTAWIGQEARHAAESLGLTPRAMAHLGWEIDG